MNPKVYFVLSLNGLVSGLTSSDDATRSGLLALLTMFLSDVVFVFLLPPYLTSNAASALLQALITFDGVLIGFVLVLAVSNMDKLQDLIDFEGAEAKRRKASRRTDLYVLTSLIVSTFASMVLLANIDGSVPGDYLIIPLDATLLGLGLLVYRLAVYVRPKA
jgi:amino acid transporter